MSTDGTCVIGSRAHAAHVGYLCSDHADQLAAMLRDVEDEAAIVSAVPSMQARTGRGSSLASHRTPARLEAIVATDPRRGTAHLGSDSHDPWGLDETASILDTLGSWARIVREDRQLTTPAGPATVSGERDLLSRSLTWICDQPWVDECFRDVKALLGQLRAINGTRGEQPEGRCYRFRVDGDPASGECGGTIRRHKQQSTAWRPLPDRCVREHVTTHDGPAYCDRCGAEWDGAELHRLHLILAAAKRPHTEDGRPMRTAEELAADQGVSVNAIRIRLSRAGASPVRGYYDPAMARRAVDMAS